MLGGFFLIFILRSLLLGIFLFLLDTVEGACLHPTGGCGLWAIFDKMPGFSTPVTSGHHFRSGGRLVGGRCCCCRCWLDRSRGSYWGLAPVDGFGWHSRCPGDFPASGISHFRLPFKSFDSVFKLILGHVDI